MIWLDLMYFLKYIKKEPIGVSVEQREKRIHAVFYQSENGNEPVRVILHRLGRPAKTMIGEDIKFVEYNWKLDRPYVDQLRKGRGEWERTTYEVRSSVLDGAVKKEYRTLFFVSDNLMVLTHLFLKKSQKTPKIEIDLAWQRMLKWMRSKRSVDENQ